jgi:hypothetical protein
VRWPDIISNITLWEKTGEKPIEWKWIRHTIRKDENAVERTVFDWNHQGTRIKGRTRKTWRRSVIEETQAG